MKFEFSETPSDDGIVQKCPVKKLVLGVFFDGTNNNFKNIEAYRNHRVAFETEKDSSYQDFFTNVAWLYEMYRIDTNACDDSTIVGKIYIDGIGTTTGKSDAARGKGFGIAATGVNQRVSEAIQKVKKTIDKINMSSNYLIESVTLDVFGFSRGSTCARIFVNRILDAQIPVQIDFRFLGLFDTVVALDDMPNKVAEVIKDIILPASIPFKDPNLVKDSQMIKKAIRDVAIHPHLFKKVFQLCAINEYRKKFPLRSIYDHGQKKSPDYEEMMMFGAHADVGGGYAYRTSVETFKQELFAGSSDKKLNEYTAEAMLRPDELKEKAFSALRQQSLVDPSTITYSKKANPICEYYPPNRLGGRESYKYSYFFDCRRTIRPGLSIVALHIMHDKAKKAGVNLREINQAALDKNIAYKDKKKQPSDIFWTPEKKNMTTLETVKSAYARYDKTHTSELKMLKVPELDDICKSYLAYLRGEQSPGHELKKKLLTSYVHLSTFIYDNSAIDHDEFFDKIIAERGYSPEDQNNWKPRKIEPNHVNG